MMKQSLFASVIDDTDDDDDYGWDETDWDDDSDGWDWPEEGIDPVYE